MLDYPVHAFNWDDCHETNANLADVWSETDKAVMGGVCRNGLGELSVDEIRRPGNTGVGGRRLACIRDRHLLNPHRTPHPRIGRQWPQAVRGN